MPKRNTVRGMKEVKNNKEKRRKGKVGKERGKSRGNIRRQKN